mmetsp:Transcript_87121/g.241576  ORF Transcript_87121/g.241576 Transcript_87121/m.241576 type:complete len:407 (-) Transcript_87121:191-1411(-)
MLILGIAISAVSGLCTTLAAISVSWPAHKAKVEERTQTEQEHLLSVVVNLLLTGVGVALMVAACSQGPVAMIFPIAVASSLASNMVLQGLLGLAKYTNASVVGTCVLVVAGLLLPDIGPPSPGVQSEEAVIAMMTSWTAMAYIVVSLIVNVSCLLALVMKAVTNNMAMLFFYAFVGGTGTVLNTSIQKALSMEIPLVAKVFLGALYVLLSCICLGSGAMANGTLPDPSLFVPISNGVNLILNCVAGICIWQDWKRLTHGVSYTMVYILVVLGTYLVSALDVFSLVRLSIDAKVLSHTAGRLVSEPVRESLRSRYNVALLTRTKSAQQRLLEDESLSGWPHLRAGIALLGVSSLKGFEKRLTEELDKNLISSAEVAALCSGLLERTGGLQSADGRGCLEEWVSNINA